MIQIYIFTKSGNILKRLYNILLLTEIPVSTLYNNVNVIVQKLQYLYIRYTCVCTILCRVKRDNKHFYNKLCTFIYSHIFTNH